MNMSEAFRQFVEAMVAADFATMRKLTADDIVAYVTNAQGGVDQVTGAEQFLARIPDATVLAEHIEVAVTQSVVVSADQILAMVDIHASRKGMDLHNHSAFLLRFARGKITEYYMVEALPAYSDEFWSA